MSYTIGSFNLYKLNLQSNEDVRKNFRRIAEIISSERFDVIALQEVFSELAVKTLVSYLGSNEWEYCLPPRYIGKPEYAFLWRKRRLHLVEKGENPRIFENYHSDQPGQTKLIYPPLVARFTPQGLLGGSNFEIRLINTHISFSKTSADDAEDDGNMNAVEHRQSELRTLCQQVYRSYSTVRDGSNMPAYTILLGDYNLCIGEYPRLEETIDITALRKVKTVQSQRTTVRQKAPDNPQNAEAYYSKNYDHFSYEVDLLDKLSLVDSRVTALGDYYSNELDDYRREISDHVPIKLTLNLIKG